MFYLLIVFIAILIKNNRLRLYLTIWTDSRQTFFFPFLKEEHVYENMFRFKYPVLLDNNILAEIKRRSFFFLPKRVFLVLEIPEKSAVYQGSCHLGVMALNRQLGLC